MLSLVTCRVNLDGVIWMVYSCNFLINFSYSSVALPSRLRIPRGSFLIFITSSKIYALLLGIGAALSIGFVDGVALALSGEVGAGGGG